LREALLAWVMQRLQWGTSPEWAERSKCLTLQNAIGVSLGVAAESSGGVPAKVVRTMLRDQRTEREVLRVTDYLLSLQYQRSASVQELEAVLLQGRSRWMVGTRHGKPGLVERVPQGVQDAVEGVIASAGTAGALLAKAWADVHGIASQDSAAYANAVRAVETAAIAVVMPKKVDATLGTVIGQMKADGDWRLPFREHPDAQSADLLLAMLRTLWVGHRDRHGNPDYSDVTHEEARSAVVLAATLEDWFSAAVVQRRGR
jgi:hypothetical protein